MKLPGLGVKALGVWSFSSPPGLETWVSHFGSCCQEDYFLTYIQRTSEFRQTSNAFSGIDKQQLSAIRDLTVIKIPEMIFPTRACEKVLWGLQEASFRLRLAFC